MGSYEEAAIGLIVVAIIAAAIGIPWLRHEGKKLDKQNNQPAE